LGSLIGKKFSRPTGKRAIYPQVGCGQRIPYMRD
jgi:hypothetical protein